jgi:hypothetical protein
VYGAAVGWVQAWLLSWQTYRWRWLRTTVWAWVMGWGAVGMALGNFADARLFCRKCYYGRRFARDLSSVGYRNSQAIAIPAALMQQQPGLNQVGATGFASQGGAQQGFELAFFAA